MVFTAGSALLDAVVLSVVSQGGTYGYKITQDVRKIMDVSESTLYPVLRRLQKDGCLETYDMEFQGRNRRYYKITSNGMIVLDNYRNEWRNFSNNVNGILMGNGLKIDTANLVESGFSLEICNKSIDKKNLDLLMGGFMTKEEYLNQLKMHLNALTQDELSEALQYYSD